MQVFIIYTIQKRPVILNCSKCLTNNCYLNEHHDTICYDHFISESLCKQKCKQCEPIPTFAYPTIYQCIPDCSLCKTQNCYWNQGQIECDPHYKSMELCILECNGKCTELELMDAPYMVECTSE
ncbi:Hypothetical_protein [Hexamita inflata]|uniref:Hypothetical_protein n=1 Tax=Hexamita inflata TaxID=28002 RepID=A0AA86NCG8_9EUKA|nr:Hypothetical protein HINF_LOCUS4144 [Hexamita inflata]